MWRAAGFSWNDVMAAVLKVWRHIRNPTTSIDALVHPRNSPAKFDPDRIWNDGALGFWKSNPNKKKKQNKNKMTRGYGISTWSKNNYT